MNHSQWVPTMNLRFVYRKDVTAKATLVGPALDCPGGYNYEFDKPLVLGRILQQQWRRYVVTKQDPPDAGPGDTVMVSGDYEYEWRDVPDVGHE